jgi:hypothetical protein
MPKVSIKFQRRIAELDAQYTVSQPKRPSGSTAFRTGIALIILAIIALAALATYRNTSVDFSRLTLKQGNTASQLQNSVWGAAPTGFKRASK